LLQRLGLAGSDSERRERALAERKLTEAALLRLDELAADERIDDDDAELLRQTYERRLQQAQREGRRLGAAILADLHAARLELLAVQHDLLNKLHRDGDISFSVLRQVPREVDLEQASLKGEER
jgi:CPA1 family monovalent cation:H+ antiporter